MTNLNFHIHITYLATVPFTQLNTFSHMGLIKPQSGPLSFADIYFTPFIALYVKIIWESVLNMLI